jgi:zinc protease
MAPCPAKPVPPRIRPAVPPANGESVLTLRDKSVEQAMVDVTFVAPSVSRNKLHALALQVLENILDGGAATRLYKSLVSEQKKAVSVHFSYDGTGLDYGTISFSGIPAEGVSPEVLKALMQAEIDKIIQNGVTDEEVREAVARLSDESVFARDSVAGPAMIFGEALTTGSQVEDVENWASEIQAVSAENVKDVAALYLNASKPYIRPPVTGYLYPAESK